MGMKRLILAFAAVLWCGCTDDVDVAEYAVDVDQSGALDCADLEHVLACVHHEETSCDHDDVNHDGTVDEHDAHDIHAGLEHHGVHCDAP